MKTKKQKFSVTVSVKAEFSTEVLADSMEEAVRTGNELRLHDLVKLESGVELYDQSTPVLEWVARAN